MKELIEQIGGRAALQDLIDNPRMANCDETAFLASALLAVLDAQGKAFGCDSCGGNGAVVIDHGEMGVEHMECPKCFKRPPAASAPDALREAVNAIYFNDSSDYLSALWSVIRALSPETADLFSKDERAAFEMVNANIKHAAAPAPGGNGG